MESVRFAISAIFTERDFLFGPDNYAILAWSK